MLSWLKEKSLKEDISVFIDNVFKNIDYFKNYLDSNTEEKQLLEIFKNFANEFKEKYQVSKLEDFLFYLDLTMKLYEDISIEENEFNEDTRDKVNIMTVHKAKGLEFDNVFIANLSEQRFPQRFKTKPFEIPEILVKENLPKKEVYLEEERRLFYVAVTRAKKSLFLSYAENYGGVRQKKPSIFLEEINSLPIKKEVFCLNKPKLDNKNKIVNKKEKLYLSYTQIDTYKTCPLKYKYAYIDNVPFKPTLSLAFGNFIHSMLEGIYNDYKKCKSFNNKFLEDLINQKWPENIFINKKQEEEYKNKTIEMLNIYTDKHKCKFHIPLYIEFPFEIDIGNNIVLKGRIDRIDNIDNNIIELIDFKSSFSLPSQREIDRDNQMTIYALAAKKILNLTPELLTVYYVMLDEKFNTKRSDKDIKILESDINETADKIRQFIYQPKKGWVCRFCNFNFICPEMERKY